MVVGMRVYERYRGGGRDGRGRGRDAGVGEV